MSHSPDPRPTRRMPVDLSDTTIDDPFWTPRLQMLRTTTLDDVFTKFERDGAFRNFDRVARGETSDHAGFPWFDGLVFETMRAASDFLATAPDPALDARMDGYIERIAAAQAADPDGYLNTYVTLTRPDTRWGANGGDQLFSHEEYNAGCLVEAAVHHYRATRKTTLLALAVRFADYMCALIGPAPRRNIVPSHSLPEEAFLKLAILIGERPDLATQMGVGDDARYLDLVRFWMDARGDHRERTSFVEYAQDHAPVVDQTEAVGHAVRATLLYTGLAALANHTGEQRYTDAAVRLWQDVTQRKLYITGGAGAIDQYEGFGFGYYLPSDGYNETCAGVGMAFWAEQMQLLVGDAAYTDLMERELYNNVLAGIALHGAHYSYQNPLVNHGKVHRWEWHSCPCCPPMLLKLYAALPGSIYAQDQTSIYVNHYIGSTTNVVIAGGKVELRLESGMPWHGTARITVDTEQARRFALRCRMPGWSASFTVRVGGQPVAVDQADGYAVIERDWQDGDTVEIEMEMPVQRVIAHPSVSHLRGRVALERGPLVYCAEGVDVGATEPTLAADAPLAWSFAPDLLDGLGVIDTEANDTSAVRAIPYYAWDNRPAANKDEDWMAIWLRQDRAHAERHKLEGDDRRGWEGRLYRPLPVATKG